MKLRIVTRKPGDPFFKITHPTVQDDHSQDLKIRAMLEHYMPVAVPPDFLERPVPALEGKTPRQYVAEKGLHALETVLDANFNVGHASIWD